MIIKEITLNNFRIYNGRNTIDLEPNDNENIIIVSGENGFGKTTFLMSLVWCLYGKQMENVDELYKREIRDQRSYSRYIASSLNKNVAHGNSSFSVSILFGNVDSETLKCKEIRVTRSYNTRSSAADDLVILFDGKEIEEWKYLDKNERINLSEFYIREHILPIEIAKFYFFDAEKIVAFADSNEQRGKISKAYAQVLGIQRFVDLKEEMEKVREEYRKASVNSEETNRFQQLCDSIDQADQELAMVSEEISRNQSLIEENRAKSDELQTRIVREGNYISDEDLAIMREQEENYTGEMENAKDGIKVLYNHLPFAICGNLLAETIEQVKRENRFKQQKQSFENVEEKANQILTDLDHERYKEGIILDYNVRAFYDSKIKELILAHFFNNSDAEDFNDFSVLHGMTEIQEATLTNLAIKVKDTRKDFAQLFSKYSNAKAELGTIQQRIREAEMTGDSPVVEALRNSKAKIDSETDQLNEDIGRYKVQIGTISEQQKKDKQQKEILSKKISLSDDVKRFDDELERLIKILDEFIKSYKLRKLQSLKEKIAYKLKSFMHKEDLIKDVDVFQINDDEIIIDLIDMQGKRIDQNSLSMGERQLFSSAILGSLVEETDFDFPVFIDSPLQKLDISHSSNILRKFYPTVSKQVVMFPLLYKELTEKEYEVIKTNVSKVYRIEHNKKGSFFTQIKDKDDLFK